MCDKLLTATETLYDCVGDTYDHDRALKAYSQLTDDSAVILADMNVLLAAATSLHWYNIEEEATWTFANRYDCPVREELIHAIMSAPLFAPVLRQSIVSGERWFSSNVYERGSKPWGMHGEMGSLLSQTSLTKTFCFLERHKGQRPLDAETLSRAVLLNHHFHRAINLQTRIDSLEEALIRSNNILDLIEFGLILYDMKQAPVFVNAAARRMLAEEDGIRLRPNELEIRDRNANQQLNALISAIYKPGLDASQYSGGMVAVPRPSHFRPYSLMVVPMRSQKLNLTGTTAAVFMFDPNARKTTAIQMFVSSYDLTRSEAELAHSLALGNSLEEAATKRGVSRNTAKSQLHSIFGKTETSRQSELVSLLLRSVAGIGLES